MNSDPEKEIEILLSKVELVITQNHILTIRNQNLIKENTEYKKTLIEKENTIKRLEFLNKSCNLAANLQTLTNKEALKEQIDTLINDVESCLIELS